MSQHAHVSAFAHKGQKRKTESLELDLQVVVNHHCPFRREGP